MKQKIITVVLKKQYILSKFKPNDVFLQPILCVHFCIYFMGHERGGNQKPLKCKQRSGGNCTRHWAHYPAGMVYNDQS